MRMDTILRVISKLLIPAILIYALYVQFHGDYGPGGGFQAGVIFAAGLILYGLVYGLDALQKVVTPRFVRIMVAVGLALYLLVGVANMMLGGRYLEYGVLSVHPEHGQHMGILLVELGVGITVASVMLTVFYGFAGRERR